MNNGHVFTFSLKIKRRFFAAFFALIAALAFTAAGLAAKGGRAASAIEYTDPTGRGIGFASILYDGSNGLPTSEANAIVQSGNGLIWIGSYSGLIRYDGNSFYRYDSSTGIASVMSLFVDSRDRLWVGTNDSGIAVLNDEEFVFYGRADGLVSSSVRSIAEDDKGNIFIATTNGIAYIDADGTLHVINSPQVNGEYVCELYSTGDIIYGITNNYGFFTVENCKVTAFYGTAETGDKKVNTVYPDPRKEGFIYLGTDGSEIYYVDLKDNFNVVGSYTVQNTDPEPKKLECINSIRLINGLLWICADNGIGYFDAEMNFVKLLDVPLNNSIDHMVEDFEGNLWFSSSRQGIMKIVENRFTDIFTMAGWTESFVANSTYKYGEDLYIATDSGLRVLDSSYAEKNNAATALLAGKRIRCIKKDGAGNLWFCHYGDDGKLVRYDPQTDAYFIFDVGNGLASNKVRMLKELSDGRIAVATSSGVNIISGDSVVATYNRDSGISNLEILCVEEMTDGRLMFGSDGGGIYIADGTRVSVLGISDGLKSEVILRIKKDVKEELYWIITSNSVAYYKNGTITTVKNMPYSNNFDLFFDDYDRLWILSSNGIYVINREELFKDDRITFVHYDMDGGLPGIATANSYSYIDEDGVLYVAASTGIYSVNINDERENVSNIKLSVPYISLDDKTVWIHQNEIRVPYDCKRINIHANAFTYSLADPHIMYYLEGFDDTPVYTTKSNMTYASYTNLKGGTYRFHISILNSITGDEERSFVLTLIKDTAVYERPWFIGLCGLLGVLLIFGATVLIYRRKTAKLLKKQEENKKLINEMTQVFSSCIDMKDAYTNGHSARVAKYTAMFAKRMGKSDEEVEQVYNIALLHDIGKISIPDNILNKPGRLDDAEFKIMKSHSSRGYEILKNIDIAPGIALGAGFHHEKYDGTGYPSGLKGEQIPEVAQIIAVADAFDAMYSTRPYRKQMPLDAVIAEIQRCSGTQFNPKVVQAFLSLAKEGAFDNARETPAAGQPENGKPDNDASTDEK
ncbi:MAG: HD domain-containing protein [Clostridia bacterium]|nr:HD domain-containing protein [Clostridia bacterium]